MRSGGSVVLLALSSCYPLEGYACIDDAECSSRPEGTCLPVGCAYPDDDCASGLRYSDLAVGTVAGACVEPDAAPDESSSGSSCAGPVGCDAVDCGGGDCVMVDDVPACACGIGSYAVPGPTCLDDPCGVVQCYYVDADAPDGGSGSLASPWNSLDAAIAGFASAQQPGDHLMLRRGARFEGSLSLDAVVGTEDAPIVVGAYGPDPSPPSVQQVGLFNSTFVTVRDLEIDGTGFTERSGFRAEFVDHLIVRDIHVHDVLSEGIGLHYGVEFTVLAGNRVERVMSTPENLDPNLVSVADDWWNGNTTDIGDHHFIIDNVLIGLESQLEGSTDRGIVLSNRDGVGDFKVLGNRISGVQQQGIWFQGGGFAWIMGNEVDGIQRTTGLPPYEDVWAAAVIISHGARVRLLGNLISAAGLPFLAGAGGGEVTLEVAHNTFAGGLDDWALWIGDVRGSFQHNLVVPDAAAAVFMTGDLSAPQGFDMADNVYAAESCRMGVFGETPLSFDQWQALGDDAASVCGPVPGISSEAFVPDPSWPRCETPAGARRCDGEPTVSPVAAWPSMPDNGGRGWEGPALVRHRYPIE